MKQPNLYATELFFYYAPLLQRYARRLIKDGAVAATLAVKVLKEQHEWDGLAPNTNLRSLLKTELCNRCHYWLQAKAFDQSPVDIPLPKYNQTNSLKDQSFDATNQ